MQQLSPSGSGVHFSQPPRSGAGKRVLCYSGCWWSPGRHTSQEGDFSVCPPEKQKSAFLVTLQFQGTSLESVLVGQVRAQLRRLSPCTLSSASMAAFLTTQGTWQNPDSQPAWPLPHTPALIVDCFTTNCMAACCFLSQTSNQIPRLPGSFLMAACFSLSPPSF